MRSLPFLKGKRSTRGQKRQSVNMKTRMKQPPSAQSRATLDAPGVDTADNSTLFSGSCRGLCAAEFFETF